MSYPFRKIVAALSSSMMLAGFAASAQSTDKMINTLTPAVFARYPYSGAAIWAASFITLGWYVGARWEIALAAAHRHLLMVAIAIVILAGLYALAHRWWLRR